MTTKAQKTDLVALILVIVLTTLAVPMIPFLHIEILDGFPTAKLVALLISCGCFLALWGLGLLRGKRSTIRITPALVALGMFVVALFVSSLFARDVYAAFFGEEYALLGFVVYGIFAIIVFLFVQTVNTPQDLKHVANWLVAVATIMALVGIAQSLGHDILFRVAGYEWLQDLGYSTAGNPDFLGFALVLPLILGAGLALNATKRKAVVLLIAVALMTTCLVLTTTRASWVAAGVGMLVLLTLAVIQQLSIKRILMLIVALVLGASCAITRDYVRDMDIIVRQTFGATIHEYQDPQSGSALGGRVGLWEVALDLVKEDPLLGVGPGNYRFASYRFIGGQDYALSGPDANNSDPHGYLFFLAATTGLIGLALGSIVLALGFKGSFQRIRPLLRDRERRGWVSLTWMVAMGALCINALAAVSEINGYLFFFIGLAGLATMGKPQQYLPRPSLITMIGYASVGIGIILCLLGSLTFTSAVIQQRQAQRVPSEETLLRQTQAIDIAPWRIAARTDALYTISAHPVLMNMNEYRLFVDRQWPIVRYYPSTAMSIANTLYDNEADTDEIMSILESVLSIAPNRVDALAMKGALLIEEGDTLQGLALISQAWELELFFPPEYQSFSITTLYVHQLIQAGKGDEAQAAIERALLDYPGNPTLLRLRDEYSL